MAESRGLKALDSWAKRVTKGYSGVNVTDMSSSFRNGLAFCAIIHHYYPELIDFESLSKENVLHNNSLAFSTAEKQLGVPALLDAEDMVKYSVPDRLSIITYLSQLHNCFENQNRVNKAKPAVKRILAEQQSGPPVKVPFDGQKNSSRTHELCQVCKHRVFILERLMVMGKLYHRTCFKCCKCDTILKPGAYVESDSPDSFECAICPRDEKQEKSDTPVKEQSAVIEKKDLKETSVESKETTPVVTILEVPKSSNLSSSLNTARNTFLQSSVQNGSTCDINNSLSVSGESLNDSYSMNLDEALESMESLHGTISDEDILKETETVENRVNEENTADHLPNEENIECHLPLSTPTNNPEIEPASERPYQTYQSIFTREMLQITSLTPSAIQKEQRRSSAGALDSLYIGRKGSGGDSPANRDVPLIRPSSNSKLALLPRPSSVSNFQPRDQPTVLNSIRTGKINSEEKVTDSDLGIRAFRRTSLDLSNKIDRHFKTDGGLETTVLSVQPDVEEKLSRKSSVNGDAKRWDDDINRKSSINDNSKCLPDDISPRTSVRQLIQLREASIRDSKVVNSHVLTSENNRKSTASDSTDSSTAVCSTLDSLSDLSEVDVNSLQREQLPVAESEKTDTETVESKNIEKGERRENLIKGSNEVYSELPSIQKSRENKPEVKNISSENKKSSDVNVSIKFIKKSVEKPNQYPDDLNPFGDDEDDIPVREVKPISYPDTLNPFGDSDDDEKDNVAVKISVDYDDSKNPFASDDDEEQEQVDTQPYKSVSSTTPSKPPIPAIRTSISPKTPQFQQSSTSLSSMDSPTGSVTGTHRKRQAPKPPHVKELFVNISASNVASPTSPSPRITKRVSSPKVLKSKRAPPPPSPSVRHENRVKDDEKRKGASSPGSDSIQSVGRTAKSPSPMVNGNAEELGSQWKKKKRPAPPVPIPSRREIKKIPVKEINAEMNGIEEKQMELEKQGRELEVLIRDKDGDEEPTVEEEESIMQLFELVHQKNALFRRQAELMYIKRSQRLEEEQVELEYQIRCLMQKPVSQRNEEDKSQEEQLVQRLLDVVDQRNEIVDSIEMDRKREAAEDVSVQEQTEIKNGDLPIAAEIKEKSAKKKKKKEKGIKKEKAHEKTKKEKSKKDKEIKLEGEEGKKNTLKGKKWF